MEAANANSFAPVYIEQIREFEQTMRWSDTQFVFVKMENENDSKSYP